MWDRRPGWPGECHPPHAASPNRVEFPVDSAQPDWKGIEMEVIVRRHITVPARFRQHATTKLAKLEKLDQKAVRMNMEVSEERDPRQADRGEPSS